MHCFAQQHVEAVTFCDSWTSVTWGLVAFASYPVRFATMKEPCRRPGLVSKQLRDQVEVWERDSDRLIQATPTSNKNEVILDHPAPDHSRWQPRETPVQGCYRAQARSAHHTIGQWIREMRCWGKEETVIREPADWEDGRTAPQNNHLLGVWVPGSCIDQRWGEVRNQSKKAINLANI